MDTTDKLLAERGSIYGDFTTHASVTQQLKEVMRAHPGWAKLSPVQKEALDMDAHKTGRILNGDPNYVDNWEDKAGYARLAAERCKMPEVKDPQAEWDKEYQKQLNARPSNDGITYPGKRINGADQGYKKYSGYETLNLTDPQPPEQKGL